MAIQKAASMKQMLLILLIWNLISWIKAQQIETDLYDGLVFGLGWGTFLIIVFIIIGAILIFFRKMLKYPGIMIGIGIGLPLITFIILYLWPKEDDDDNNSSTNTSTEDDPTNFFLVKVGLCFTLACVFFLFGLFTLAYATIFRFVYARREDTSRIEKFKRTQDVDTDDEEIDAFEMNKYDLEEEEDEEEDSVIDEDYEDMPSQPRFDDEEEEEDRQLINS